VARCLDELSTVDSRVIQERVAGGGVHAASCFSTKVCAAQTDVDVEISAVKAAG
jgi:hypothetical protein